MYLYARPLLIMRKFRLLTIIISLLALCLFVQEGKAQQKVEGIIVDKATAKGIAQASVSIIGASEGTSCDAEGRFQLSTNRKAPYQLLISAVGYTDRIFDYRGGDGDLSIALESNDNLLDAVEVSRKVKYKNRNPAVDLINQVIKHKRTNRLENQARLTFKQYDKLQFGLVNPAQGYSKRLGSIGFVFENVDTISAPGSRLLTMFMQEQLSDVYSKNDPKAFKKRVKSVKQTDFDPRYVNNHNIQSYLSYLFQDIEIYDENIFLIDKLFLSPIANNAPVFYKYYLTDTVQNNEGRFIEVSFEPRNKTDLLLSGRLHISMDDRFAVRLAELRVNKESNLNWVNDVYIELIYQPNAENIMFLEKSSVNIVFGTGKRDAVYGRKTSLNYDYDFDPSFSDDVFSGAPTEILPIAKEQSEMIDQKRPLQLSPVESRVYTNIDSLNQDRTFKTLLALGYLFGIGYYPLGPIEFGPLEYLYSRNNIEGDRIRIGGRTTSAFSEKLFIEGYLAYGIRDGALKYFVRPTLSLNGESVAKFPAHYIQAAVQHDIFDPGRNLGFRKGDSFFQSIRRNRPTKWMDTDAYQLTHLIEFGNHVSLASSIIHHQRRAIGNLQFISSADNAVSMPEINTNELQFILRWAPNEKFYYRNLSRNTIIEKYPVFNLQYNRGLDGFRGGNYAFDAVRASVSKRFFLKQLGFADLTLAGGKIWGTLPYPLLEIPDVFREEDRHVIDYTLMRSTEFVADEYVRIAVEHKLEGFIFNKIPLIKRLNLRELWGVKMFYGNLTDGNNPYVSDNVIRFDRNTEGQILTHVMDKSPYWEGKVGIDNIFRILRVEYVKRLNYLNLPDVQKDAYRVSLHLNF